MMRFIFALIAFLYSNIYLESALLSIDLNNNQGKIPNTSIGIHFVYFKIPDLLHDKLETWTKTNHIHIARYPGGTVLKGWDWKVSNGGGYRIDPWSPDYKYRPNPSKNWMSLDEYLTFVKKSGMIPLIGVNYISGILYHRQHDGIRRAVELVKYVKRKGFEKVFYYIGNEDIGMAGGVKKAAAAIKQYAKAMKQVAPEIKILWNDNHINKKRLKRFLSIAGKWVDGCEFHGKWPYGGKRSFGVYTLSDWQNQNPIKIQKRGIYSRKIATMRTYAKELGYPNLMFCNNEYGLNGRRMRGFNRYTKSLVLTDYLMNLMIGRFDMTALWSTVGKDTFLIDKTKGYRFNPIHFSMEFLARAQGKEMIESKSDNPKIPVFAVKGENRIFLYILNKSSKIENIVIDMENLPRSANLKENTVSILTDGNDHWGKVVKNSWSTKDDRIIAEIPALSFTMVEIPLK